MAVLLLYGVRMGFSIKEAIDVYIRSNISGDMEVRVDESPDIIGIGRRDGKIVPIVRPGSTLTAEEIMQKAGIDLSRRPRRGTTVLSPDIKIITISPRSRKRPPGRLH